MSDLVRRLLEEAILFDRAGAHGLAKLLTEAIEEIENARHIRNQADESAEQKRDAQQPARDGT